MSGSFSEFKPLRGYDALQRVYSCDVETLRRRIESGRIQGITRDGKRIQAGSWATYGAGFFYTGSHRNPTGSYVYTGEEYYTGTIVHKITGSVGPIGKVHYFPRDMIQSEFERRIGSSGYHNRETATTRRIKIYRKGGTYAFFEISEFLPSASNPEFED